MQLNLQGKVVVVTGGTRGIGRAMVEGFIREGASVHFCARTMQDAKASVEALTSLATQYATVISGAIVDVSKPHHLEDWIKEIASKEGRIDVIVSNVSSLSVANTPESWGMGFQTDIMGTVTLINTALPYLEKSKGNIVTISSVSGRDMDGVSAASPYGTFKAALIAYTAQLAHTLAPRGIRANTVCPGNIYVSDGLWGGIQRNNPRRFNDQLSKNPTGRMGKPEEVANAVLFLASNNASFISGSNLVVDGSLCSGIQF